MACAATERILVGTNIALAFPRSPTITAMTARDLAELSGGRFILGLGTQVKRVNEQRFGIPFEHPAPKLEEAATAIRRVIDAFGTGRIEHAGRFYQITMPPFPGAGRPPGPVPIHFAAVNQRMCEAAGRSADGVLGHPMTSPRYIREVVRPAVERGAAAAGRDPSDVSISTSVILQIGDDADVARREAAAQLAFYATTRTYRPVLEVAGFEQLTDPLREAFGRGDLPGMVELALPMVDELAIAGTAADCRERVEAFADVVDRVILGGAWVGPSPDRLIENHLAIVETFGS